MDSLTRRNIYKNCQENNYLKIKVKRKRESKGYINKTFGETG